MLDSYIKRLEYYNTVKSEVVIFFIYFLGYYIIFYFEFLFLFLFIDNEEAYDCSHMTYHMILFYKA